jgi:hypothetical protein
MPPANRARPAARDRSNSVGPLQLPATTSEAHALVRRARARERTWILVPGTGRRSSRREPVARRHATPLVTRGTSSTASRTTVCASETRNYIRDIVWRMLNRRDTQFEHLAVIFESCRAVSAEFSADPRYRGLADRRIQSTDVRSIPAKYSAPRCALANNWRATRRSLVAQRDTSTPHLSAASQADQRTQQSR